MKISENIMNYIKEEAEKLHYGSITIEINETNNKVDIITEKRHRFEKEDKYNKR